MSFLHSSSCECLKEELSLFTIPPTQTTIESSQWVNYKPISSLSDDSPIEFVVPGSGEEYIDLAHTMLHLRVKIKNTSGEELTEGKFKVGPVNNFLHSMFNQVEVSFNQKLVTPANNAYAYRAYIETLLNYGAGAKNSHLSNCLWYDDTPGLMDEISDSNLGFKTRSSLTEKEKCVDLQGHLHTDIFNQEKYLLNGIELRVKLIRSRDSFCLMETGSNAHTVNIMEATLLIRRAKINPGILIAHTKALSKATAKYPLTRVEVKTVTMRGGVLGETLDNIILGQLPKRIIIGFVDNKAFNGDKKYNPFNFKHYNINFFSLYIDGTQIPSKPLQPNFKENLYADAYHTLYSGTGIHFSNQGNNISRESYAQGSCLFAFDLTPDLSANSTSHWNLVKHGSMRIEVRFAEPLVSTVNCILYAEYDNVLEIDSSRQVIVDFSS